MRKLSDRSFEHLFGFGVNVCELPLDSVATPSSIRVEQFDEEEQLSRFMNQGEYFLRRAFYGDMEPPHFICYGSSIIRLLPVQGQQIRILLIGSKSKKKCASFVKALAKNLKLGLDRIEVNFIDPDFLQILQKGIEKTTAPAQDILKDQMIVMEKKIEPKVKFEVFTQGKWQQPIEGSSINGIKLKVLGCNIRYRIYSRNEWWPWVENGDCAGLLTYPIKGLQFEFENEKYELLYKFHFLNKEKIDWRGTMKNPTRRIIDGIDFKLKKKE